MKNHVSPWSTWDIKSINAVMNIRNMFEVKVGVYNAFEKTYMENAHPAKHISRYGIHSACGDYFDIDYKTDGFVFNMEFASDQDKFVIKLTPKTRFDDIYYYISAHIMWNAYGMVKKEADYIYISSKDETFHLHFLGNIQNVHDYYFNSPGFLINTNDTVYIFCNMDADALAADKMLAEKKEKASLKDSTKAKDAIYKAIMWNTVYDPVNDRIITPVTRAWCLCDNAQFSVFGTYVLFCWDTFFAGLLASVFDKNLAYNEVYTILSEATDRGMIPNTNAHRKKSLDRSQPPVGSYCVWKLYEKYKEKEFLQNTFDSLYAWNRYWIKRRKNADGLLSWGSNPYPGKYRKDEYQKMNYSHTLAAAKLESGLDNSPMYDDAVFDEKNSMMNISDIGLNSLFALDLLSLSKIAGEIGKTNLCNCLKKEYQTVKDKINSALWNDSMGIYCNKFVGGGFSTELSPTCFYPLLSGIADKDRSDRMINEHLLNEDEFWGEYVLPSTPKNSPHFKDDNYWRGRIWAPMNFLVFEGLKNSGYDKTAKQLADKSYKMFLKEWENKNIISENYHSSGEAADDPFYTWGALLAYITLDD